MDTSRNFMQLLKGCWADGRTISVGLEGEFGRLPPELSGMDPVEAVLTFHRRLIESTRHLAAAYKPQSACYELMGVDGVRVLLETIEMAQALAPNVPVILDAKRADIGSTNEKYASAVFDLYGADALTVHPYLGPEAMKPFLDRADKGIVVLCRTSNPGAGQYQDLIVQGRPLYQHIANDVADTWNYNGNCALAVGATYPPEMHAVRTVAPDLPFLVLGVGAQGGDLNAAVKAGTDARGAGLLIHASRSLMYAYEKEPELTVEEATRTQAQAMHDAVILARKG